MSTDAVLIMIGCACILSALLGILIFPNIPSIRDLRIPTMLRVFLSVFGLALLLMGIYPSVKSVFGPVATSNTKPPKDPIHVTLTTNAWQGLNNENYTDAIKYSDECIDQFEQEAFRIQKKLETNGYQLPDLESLTKEQEDEIFRHGVLNDVATCWYIKGRALEKSNNKENAMQAYREVTKFKFACTWDPNRRKFWSPSQAAADRLQALAKQ